MTVETESGGLPVLKSGPYAGNGVTAAFDYDFPVQAEDEVEVLRQNADLTVTTLTLTTHYTVSGVGADAGGQITIVDPATNLPTGTNLLIRYTGDFLQAVDWSNQSGLQLAQIEAALDKQMMHLRQIKEQLGRTAQTDAFEATDLAGLTEAINAVVAIASDVTTVAGISANVTTVAGDSADIATLAAISADITTAAGIAAEIAVVAADSADINTLAAISTDISTLAAINADITALATATGGTLTGNWTAGGIWDFDSVSHMYVPGGTTAERPGGSPSRAVRYNSSLAAFEVYFGGGGWHNLLVTLDTLAEGDTLYSDSLGRMKRLAAGTEGQVLRQGATFPEWGYDGNKAILAAEYASGTTPTQFPSGAWGALELNTERYDGIGVSLASNQITFANAGTYRIVASVNSQNNSGGNRRGQLRAYNVTQTVAAGYGGANSSQTAAVSPTTLDTVITVAASDVVEVQGRADGTALYVYGDANWGGETGLQVTIERLE